MMLSKTLHVLIVDDSEATQTLLRAGVEAFASAHGMSARVETSSSGFEALRLLPANELDLIITDINMPDVHGLELIAFVRQNPLHRDTPVLVVSTQGSSRDQEKALALGANAYCVKPVAIDSLFAALERLVGPSFGILS